MNPGVENGPEIEVARRERVAELQRYTTSPDLRALDLDVLTIRFQLDEWSIELAAVPSWRESGEFERYEWAAQAFWHGRGIAHEVEGYGTLGAVLAHFEHLHFHEDE